MNMATFDALSYFEELKGAGVPEAQARVQADGMRAQTEAVRMAFKEYDAEQRKEVSTRGDVLLLQKDLRESELRLQNELRETELKLQKEIEIVRADIRETEMRLHKEIEIVKADIRETEMRLQKEIATVKADIVRAELRLIKWQVGIGFAVAVPILTALAKGFRWFGF